MSIANFGYCKLILVAITDETLQPSQVEIGSECIEKCRRSLARGKIRIFFDTIHFLFLKILKYLSVQIIIPIFHRLVA